MENKKSKRTINIEREAKENKWTQKSYQGCQKIQVQNLNKFAGVKKNGGKKNREKKNIFGDTM